MITFLEFLNEAKLEESRLDEAMAMQTISSDKLTAFDKALIQRASNTSGITLKYRGENIAWRDKALTQPMYTVCYTDKKSKPSLSVMYQYRHKEGDEKTNLIEFLTVSSYKFSKEEVKDIAEFCLAGGFMAKHWENGNKFSGQYVNTSRNGENYCQTNFIYNHKD